MLLFSRQVRLTGSPSSIAWAMAVTEKANQHSATPISLWSGRYGLPYGAIAWSTIIEDLATGEEFNGKMAADADAVALLDAGSDHVQEVMPDTLSMVIHGAITERTPVGGYLGAVNATATPGNMSAAGAWAVHAADTYTSITGVGAVVTATIAGEFGQFGWLVQHADAAGMQAALMATATSDEYRELLENGGPLFHPGAMQAFAQRIA